MNDKAIAPFLGNQCEVRANRIGLLPIQMGRCPGSCFRYLPSVTQSNTALLELTW